MKSGIRQLFLETILLVSLWLLGPSFTEANKEKLFYIYDYDEWPSIATASIYKRDRTERLENQLHHGAGPLVNENSGIYHTDQYQLFSMVYYRALRDPRRTLDPAKATSFLVPYDFASDAAYYKNCAKSKGVCFDFRRCPLAPKVEELLKNSVWYQRNQGKDHVLIVGMNYCMDHYILKPLCKSLLSKTCSNCTKFAIDDYSFMYATDHGIVNRGDNWHAAPFPGDFHWSPQVKRPFPWEETRRPILVSYTGSDRSFYGPARRLRQSLYHYCGLHAEGGVCLHKTYGLNGTRFSYFVEGYNPLSVSQSSVFCFQPIGDLMTRKGLFDGLLQGCIPVVFDALTAEIMYTWHWEEAFWKDVIVTLPYHPVAFRYMDPVKYLQDLMTNNASLIQRKQELIRSRIFQLQYSLNNREDVYQYNSNLTYITVLPNNSIPHPHSQGDEVIYDVRLPKGEGISMEKVSHESSWPTDEHGKPMKDAYDIIMDYILGWHSKELIDFRNATVTECWDGWLDTKANKCMPGQDPNSKSKGK